MFSRLGLVCSCPGCFVAWPSTVSDAFQYSAAEVVAPPFWRMLVHVGSAALSCAWALHNSQFRARLFLRSAARLGRSVRPICPTLGCLVLEALLLGHDQLAPWRLALTSAARLVLCCLAWSFLRLAALAPCRYGARLACLFFMHAHVFVAVSLGIVGCFLGCILVCLFVGVYAAFVL